jgi:hypothetical protein
MSALNGASAEIRDRGWWRIEARRTRTDWSSILRQRIRVLWWVRAGRPPLSEWVRCMNLEKENYVEGAKSRRV